jgi:uncharacterized membrane protein
MRRTDAVAAPAGQRMFERLYRQRLEADLVRWQADGVISPAAGEAIRAALPPPPRAVNVATVVAIVGGLLVAAAFLAFVAANWTEIARPARFTLLLAGIASAYGIGAAFDLRKRTQVADLGVAVGSIIFGAAIALVGQMYHLGDDFAGGLLLWAVGALIAAILTGSRGALAVALTAACVWSGASIHGSFDLPHIPFIGFWLVCATVAVAWNAASARHLVAVAALVWWAIPVVDSLSIRDGLFTLAAGGALLLGGGLLLGIVRSDPLRMLGQALSIYGAFGLASAAAAAPLVGDASTHLQVWTIVCGVFGLVFAVAAAAITFRPGSALAALAVCLVLLALSSTGRSEGPWLAYALALLSMVSLLASAALDDIRPRVVAGWLGTAFVIAAITWMVEGSLLRRAAFLAVAGIAAIGLASVLARLTPVEARR